MRDYVYRGRSLDGRWITGSPWVFSPPMTKAVIIHGLGTIGEDDGYTRYCDTYEVDPNTIGEFTGLYDASGRKIFEGDIIRFGSRNLAVWWNDERFQWRAKTILGIPERPYEEFSGDSWATSWDDIELGWIAAELPITGTMTSEIVGNIYDNPWLLGDPKYDYSMQIN